LAITTTYPGVYIQELPSQVHTIVGVATSITAFVGYTARGIDNRAEAIYSFADFQRLFGGLAADSELSYAVQQFFANGGTQGYVVRVPRHGATGAAVTVGNTAAATPRPNLTFTALSSGSWANGALLIDVDADGVDHTSDATAFNLTVTNPLDGIVESFPSVSLDGSKSNYVLAVVNDPDTGSQLVKVADGSWSAWPSGSQSAVPSAPPAVSGIVGTAPNTSSLGSGTANNDYGVHLSISAPTTSLSAVDVKVLANGSPIPQSVGGLASQLQTALNATLAIKWPGASVTCRATGTGSSQAIRVVASVPNFPDAVLAFGAPASPLHDASGALGLASPAGSIVAHYALGTTHAPLNSETGATQGSDGSGLPRTADLIGDPAAFTGIYALDKVDLFNLLVIPDATRASAGNPFALDANLNPTAVYGTAIIYCKNRRAFLLLDSPPDVKDVASAVDWKTTKLGVHQESGAAFFPRLRLPDPLNNYQLRTFAPSGVVAGLYARIDTARGVWKAPAGTEATLTGVQGVIYKLTDIENGVLNPLGLNCFRIFPVYGPVLWGARTLVGADADASQWKYVPVRRLALYLEESLYRGTQWAVFEPNDEPLWAQLRLNIGAFMHDLFRKGAFQGQSPREAYFVKCDKDTTTQNDIDSGVVNVLVGFAPLKPAEFVVIQIQQMAGQIQV
jgi:phage tail sheath protein FI